MVLPPLLRPGGLGGTRWKHRLGFHLATKNPARFRRRRRGGVFPTHPPRKNGPLLSQGQPPPPGHGMTPFPLGYGSPFSLFCCGPPPIQGWMLERLTTRPVLSHDIDIG